MNYFDPSRQKMGTRPMVLGQMFVIPNLYIEVLDGDFCKVSLMLPSAQGGFNWHGANIPEAELSDFMAKYRADPEDVFAKYFGWEMVKYSATVYFDPKLGTPEEREAHNKTHFPQRTQIYRRPLAEVNASTRAAALETLTTLAEIEF
jgi:hypothetical protein